MKKEYMVVKFGTSQKTGEPYSMAHRMKIAKDGTWGNLDSKDKFFTDDIRSVGEIVQVEQTEVA